ncbi:MAG: DUF1611 domain-containing protein [Proteobacteria bacterium]|nr:DUF1611 domain-containing protein [Pseudomonadota bacterium]
MRSDASGRALPQPYLLFLGDITEAPFAKTAFGLRDWAGGLCIGEFALAASTVTTGLPRLTPQEAYARGARALVIGVATRGGAVMPAWIPALREAMEAGLDIISGMHSRLADNRELAAAATHLGRKLIEVRTPPSNIPVATGRKRTGKRLLTVGTDCALGKKYTALALTRALRKRGIDADFRATGQTGIMISGAGIPMDAVVADFAAGAAEMLTPDAAAGHWDVVEGQGSIFHPSYSGVSLALLHGTQPDVFVLCHEVGRERILGLETFPTPTLREAIELHLILGRRTNPQIRCAGVSLNTRGLSDEQATRELANWRAELHLPVADPVRGGAEMEQLVSACLATEGLP